MDGGVSQVDSFDPKPRLQAEHGQPFRMKMETTQFEDNGNTLGSPFKFRPYGQAGIPVSNLFPRIGRCVDDLCIIRSMRTPFAEHAQSCYLLHTGHPMQGRPSLGAWLSYGLGSENADLPGHVVINGGQLPLGGLANFSSGFLPAIHEASLFHFGSSAAVMDNIQPTEVYAGQQAGLLRFVNRADRQFVARVGPGSNQLESAISNYELARAMQTSVPQVVDSRDETSATLEMYGVQSSNPHESQYGRQCLLARRLLEQGVRFVEVTMAGSLGKTPWDQHSQLLAGHQRNAEAVDRPIAALLTDLRQRGMLDDTIVVWTGEFGRTPFAQAGNGRDHNPQGFTIWIAGGGFRRGMIYGATDEYGYHAVENIVTTFDLHATLLHQLGVDHEQLTYRFGGRDFRLTDVHGHVLQDVLA